MNWRLFLIFILIFLAFLSFVFLKKSYQEFFAPKIAVTVFPFYDLTKEIVKDKYEVVLLVPPGAEPHNFELGPKEIRKLSGVKLVFSSGTYFDKWSENLVKNFQGIKIVSLNPELIDNDPHYWLSIEKMKIVAKKIESELENFDPKNKDFYRKNLDEVLLKLEELKNFANEELKNIKSRNLVTQHNAFNYLAKELNLNVVAYIQEADKEITPAGLKNLIDKIRIYNIKVIFKEPGEESNLLKTIAKELNLKVYELDPIEGKGILNYFSAYKNNIIILKEALNQ